MILDLNHKKIQASHGTRASDAGEHNAKFWRDYARRKPLRHFFCFFLWRAGGGWQKKPHTSTTDKGWWDKPPPATLPDTHTKDTSTSSSMGRPRRERVPR